MGLQRSLAKLALSFFLILIGAGIGAFFLFRYLDSPPPESAASMVDSEEVPGVEAGTADVSLLFEVRPGETATSVGFRLRSAGLIRSTLLWSAFARLDSEPIKAGYYRLEPPLRSLEIWDLLVSGKQLLVRITVPEGFTLKKAAELIEARGVASAADFLAASEDPALVSAYGIPARTMEGFLYPDTYYFPLRYPADRVVRKMADTFFSKLSEVAPKPLSGYSAKELFERVVIASIVEREYRAVDEAGLMAGVFFNRLEINMALQSCATVEYVITEIQGKPHPEVIYNRDLEIRDPYNTYANRGLPPGPISFPGPVSLRAAFNPAPTDYLYFRLVDAEAGRHRFSRTLDEHVEAGVRYVKRLGPGS